MEKYLWPWQSKVVIDDPWVFYTFLFCLSFILSIITWIRKKRKDVRKE
ncbi:hypothetical protein FB550_10870 [Neobacillus bataviensis]|uniref:Uncharacterized protein n=1 Tax=Neobacillus bataviensis TaxID=220685 RepID=A0A561D5U2_9BACI|nr:hypothetical protein FB550_10870 [Neobacillus bataviensis]